MEATVSTPVLKAATFEGMPKKKRDFFNSIVFHVLVGGFCIIMLYPILWLFGSSLKGPAEIWTNVFALIPKEFAWGNYPEGWKGIGGVSYTTFYLNSFMYAGLGTVFAVATSALVAYGFARIRFFGNKFWFTCMILTLMLPSQVQLIPQYIFYNQLGWVNTYLPLLVPRLFGQAFFIFLMMQFIRGIPRELDEAAEIDGCSRIGIFFRIILPLIWPAIITSAIFSFYWTWEDFFQPLIYLNSPKLYTVSLALRASADPNSVTNWGAIFAMSSLSLIPVFLVFIFFQRYLVQGISTTGIKG